MRWHLTILLVKLCNFDVITTFATRQAEVSLIEIRSSRQFGSGDICKGMPVKVVEHPLHKRTNEDDENEAEHHKREAELAHCEAYRVRFP